MPPTKIGRIRMMDNIRAGRSETKILKEEVKQLKARIEELEKEKR